MYYIIVADKDFYSVCFQNVSVLVAFKTKVLHFRKNG